MQFRTFFISALTNDGAQELNAFLQTHRVLSVDKRFSEADNKWLFCVEYQQRGGVSGEKRPKVDYREVLNESDFALYSALRELRKAVADRDGVPVYAVLNNEQLAQMVQKRVDTKEALGEIEGIGATKLDKYGDVLVDKMRELLSSS